MTDDPDQLPPVEFLDQNAPQSEPGELVSTGDTRGRSIGFGLAALVIVGAGLAALASSDNADVGPPTTPTTVPQPDTTSILDRDTPPTTTGIGDGNTPTAIIGDGPELEWVALPFVPSVARQFTWTGDAFVSTDGANEWIIRPTADGTETLIEKRPGPMGDRVGRRRIPAAGADAWLAPNDTVEVAIDGEVSVVTVPPLSAPGIDLGMPTAQHHVVVNAQAIAVLRSVGFQVDDEALIARLGSSAEALGRIDFIEVSDSRLSLYGETDSAFFSLDELDLTDDELEWLRRVNVNPVLVDVTNRASGEIMSTRFEDEGRITSVHVSDQTLLAASFNYSYRSTDGLVWERRSLPSIASGLGDVNGQLFALDYSGRFPRVARSDDFGLTWSSTAHPFLAAIDQAGTGEIVLATGWSDPQPDVREWAVTRDGYRLELSGDAESFQLFDPDGELLTGGFVGDPDGGFVFEFDEIRFRWVDPETDIEVVTLESADFLRGYAAALTEQGHPMVIGAARWPDGSDDPVWGVSDVQETFGPSASSVTFVAGPGHVLAIVDTDDGERLYLAPVDPA